MKKILIDAEKNEEVRVAIVENNGLIDYESEKVENDRTKGNIYLAKIIRVEPSLQAAFVDYGGNKHGFLAYNEIHPDYFKIPTADKKKLLEQELEESKQITLNEDDEELFEDSFQETVALNKKSKSIDQKDFYQKFLIFLTTNHWMIFQPQKIKKEKLSKTIIKIKVLFFIENIAFRRLSKVIKLF